MVAMALQTYYCETEEQKTMCEAKRKRSSLSNQYSLALKLLYLDNENSSDSNENYD